MFMTVMIPDPGFATAIFTITWHFAILVVIVFFTATFFSTAILSAALLRADCSAFDIEVGLIFVQPHCDGLFKRLAGNGTA